MTRSSVEIPAAWRSSSRGEQSVPTAVMLRCVVVSILCFVAEVVVGDPLLRFAKLSSKSP